jgi:peptide deformylase
MTIRKIAQVGHPVLRTRAREVTKDELRSSAMQSFIDDLVETMHDANGAGLAAIQIYEPIRIVAMEVRDNPRYPYKPKIPLTILANPVLEPLGTETFLNFEGCLSVPNLRGRVPRIARLRVTGWDRDGNDVDAIIQGITAGTYQHECDHLDGKLFIDRVEDPSTFCTWENFERHHQAGFVEDVKAIVARYGS